MVIEFCVRNFRSIKELQTLSFVATGLRSPEECSHIDDRNIATVGDMRVLKSVGIYGANGSGKSNILRALDYFIEAIRNEASTESMLGQVCDPFLYQINPGEQESYFQIVIIIENKKYRYGFTVKRNPNYKSFSSDTIDSSPVSKEIIVSEWLFGPREKNMVALFTRENGAINKEKLGSPEAIPTLSTEHNLFLTFASAFDKNGVCALVRRHLLSWTISNFKNGFERFRKNSIRVIEQEKRKDAFLQFLSEFNLKFDDIELNRDNTKRDEVLSHEKISLIKTFFDSSGIEHSIKLNLNTTESSGTQKLFDLAGVFLRAFHMNISGLIIIDEIDSHFHPSLLLRLIKFINNDDINNGNTQLVFTTHDTNLLSPSIMRRDQFYFTEKRLDESTRLYSLADLKGIRNDADFAKQYLAGYYGAVPVLEDYIEVPTDNSINNGSLEY
jgi:uncharacterized protein